MKPTLAASIFAASIALATMASGAARADDFRFSFDTGGVRFAYRDGYWDREHHWHNWANAREREEYRHRFADRYQAYEHRKLKNEGWREEEEEREHRDRPRD